MGNMMPPEEIEEASKSRPETIKTLVVFCLFACFGGCALYAAIPEYEKCTVIANDATRNVKKNLLPRRKRVVPLANGGNVIVFHKNGPFFLREMKRGFRHLFQFSCVLPGERDAVINVVQLVLRQSATQAHIPFADHKADTFAVSSVDI